MSDKIKMTRTHRKASEIKLRKPSSDRVNYGDWAQVVQGCNKNPDILGKMVWLDSDGLIKMQTMLQKQLTDKQKECDAILKDNLKLIDIIKTMEVSIGFWKKRAK